MGTRIDRIDEELLKGSLDDDDDIVRICYYGEPGTGKTTDAAYMANLNQGKVLFFPVEDGLKKTPLRNMGVAISAIKPLPADTAEDLIKRFWEIKALLDVKPDSVAGIVIDTATELNNRAIAAITRRENAKLVRQAELAGEEFTGSRFFRDRSYWGESASELREVVEFYRSFPRHLVITAHVREDEDENSGKMNRGPAVQPAVQSDLQAFLDVLMLTRIVGQYDDGTDVFVGSVGGVPGYQLKDRFGMLPRHLVLPTFDRVYAYIAGDLTEEADEHQQRYNEWKARLKAKKLADRLEREVRRARKRGTGHDQEQE